MRLIDADELIVLAENTFSRPGGFIELIEETETAYDVDAVVAELEKLRKKLFGEAEEGNYVFGVIDAIDGAIEIVGNAGKDGAE